MSVAGDVNPAAFLTVSVLCRTFNAAMDIISIEQRNPLNAERNDEPGSRARDTQTKTGCWEKLHQSVPQYMLPKELHSVYLEKANCFPPPIFIILISIAEVALRFTPTL